MKDDANSYSKVKKQAKCKIPAITINMDTIIIEEVSGDNFDILTNNAMHSEMMAFRLNDT
jgi:hypothetical protein